MESSKRLLEMSDDRVNRLSERITELEARQCEKCESSIEENSDLRYQVAERDRRIAELEAQLATATRERGEWIERAGDYAKQANQVIDRLSAVEKQLAKANARAGAAKEWERDVRRADDELDKLGAPVTAENGRQLNLAGRIRYLFRKAEARAADLAIAKKVADAALHYFDVDTDNAEWDSKAFCALDDAVREYRAALNPDARQEGSGADEKLAARWREIDSEIDAEIKRARREGVTE